MLSFDLRLNLQRSTPAYKYVGWRSLHMQEGGYQTPVNMPAIRPPSNAVAVQMTEDIQWMSYYLMRYFNILVTSKLWTAVHSNARAFNNGTGCDIYRNYVTGERMSAELPRYDKSGRHCAGTFLRGIVDGNDLVC